MNKYDQNGLLIGLEYPKTEEGLIDWRKLIPQKYLVVNRQNFEKRGLPIPTNINGLEDKDLLILLGGIKYISKLRKFVSVEYPVVNSSENHCTAVCRIVWSGNIETNMENIVFSSLADAKPENCNGFGKYYLAAMAENRAFIRCTRNFLGINICGVDEIAQLPAEPPKTNNIVDKRRADLQALMEDKGYELSEILPKLQKSGYDVQGITSVETIPGPLVLKIIEILKEIK